MARADCRPARVVALVAWARDRVPAGVLSAERWSASWSWSWSWSGGEGKTAGASRLDLLFASLLLRFVPLSQRLLLLQKHSARASALTSTTSTPEPEPEPAPPAITARPICPRRRRPSVHLCQIACICCPPHLASPRLVLLRLVVHLLPLPLGLFWLPLLHRLGSCLFVAVGPHPLVCASRSVLFANRALSSPATCAHAYIHIHTPFHIHRTASAIRSDPILRCQLRLPFPPPQVARLEVPAQPS